MGNTIFQTKQNHIITTNYTDYAELGVFDFVGRSFAFLNLTNYKDYCYPTYLHISRSHPRRLLSFFVFSALV